MEEPDKKTSLDSKAFDETENEKEKEKQKLEKKYKQQQIFTYGIALILPVISLACYFLSKDINSTLHSFAGGLVLISGISGVFLLLSALDRRFRYENGSYRGY